MTKLQLLCLHKNSTHNKRGFTLVELVIVIAVLAIIAAIAIPTINGLIKNANNATNDSNAAAIEMTFKAFRAEYEARATYPLSSKKAALNKNSSVKALLDAYGLTLPEVRLSEWVYTGSPTLFIWNKENSTVFYSDSTLEPDGSVSTRFFAISQGAPLYTYFDWLK